MTIKSYSDQIEVRSNDQIGVGINCYHLLLLLFPLSPLIPPQELRGAQQNLSFINNMTCFYIIDSKAHSFSCLIRDAAIERNFEMMVNLFERR